MVAVDSYIYMCIDSWWLLLHKINIKARITKFSSASQNFVQTQNFSQTNQTADFTKLAQRKNFSYKIQKISRDDKPTNKISAADSNSPKTNQSYAITLHCLLQKSL